MTIVMNMSSYAIEETAPINNEYADQAMYARGYPQLELATRQQLTTLMDKYPSLPLSLVTADAETFLQKMYAYQG